MKRILLFVHYNAYNKLSDHVIYTLEKLKPFFVKIVFISNSILKNEDKERIKHLSDKIIQRENKGFDFGAWKDAIIEEGWEELKKYDSLILMNDTCFGPLFDLSNLFNEMERKDCDFWEITNHKKLIEKRQLRVIPEHLQSYFFSFNKNVFLSNVFKKFWEKVKYHKDIQKVIHKYETKLTKILTRKGFKYKSFFNSLDYNYKTPNISLHYPRLIIKNKVPFVKVKSFIIDSSPQKIIELISSKTTYPVSLIEKHFNENFPPNISFRINNKLLITREKEESIKSNLKIAMHLHCYYVDLLETYIEKIEKSNIDLYITTDTKEKKKEIQRKLSGKEYSFILKDILVFKNIGRDILPFLKISEYLKKYDIIGHFHTKKTTYAKGELGEIWSESIINNILTPINEIIKEFEKNKDIGIIIPDIPENIEIFEDYGWYSFKKQYQKLFNKLFPESKIRIDKLATPIFPYGSMFWARPDALEPIFNLKLDEKDFPEEPLPNDGTIAHAIERMFVYTAWMKGYDFRIAINEKRELKSKFFYKEDFFNTFSKKGFLIKKGILFFIPDSLRTFLIKTKFYIKNFRHIKKILK